MKKAKEYMTVFNHASFVVISILVGCLICRKEMVIGIFTDIESVKQQAYAVIGIAAAGTFPDMWQGYLQGPIKALAL